MNSKVVGWVLSSLLLAGWLRGEEFWKAPAFSVPAKTIAEEVDRLPPQGIDIDLFANDVTYRFDERGRSEMTVHLLYRVLTKAGEQLSRSVQMEWSPRRNRRPTVRARVIGEDGDEFVLDPNSVVDIPSERVKFSMAGERRVSAALQNVKVGVIIESEVIVRDIAPFFELGSIVYSHLETNPKARWLRQTVDAPASLPLACKVCGAELEPLREEKDGRIRYVFESGALPSLSAQEKFQSPPVPLYPYLKVATGKSWSAIAGGYHTLVEKQLANADVASFVQDLTQKEQPRAEKIAEIVARLRKNVSLVPRSFGDSDILPSPPAETLARRSGDSKDQATLLVALLKAAGIDAQVALICSDTEIPATEDFPGLNALNWALVYVPGSTPLWIDPCQAVSRCGELTLECQDKPALVISPTTAGLIRTPISPSTENTVVDTWEIRRDEKSLVRTKFSRELRGTHEMADRHRFAAEPRSQYRGLWENMYRETQQIDQLSSFSDTEPLDLSHPFRWEMEMEGTGYGAVELGELMFSIQPNAYYEKLPAELQPRSNRDPASSGVARKPRQTAMQLNDIYIYEENYRYLLPPGFVIRQAPADKEFTVGSSTISRRCETHGDGSFSIRFKLDTGEGRFTAEEVELFREKLAEVCDGGFSLPSYFVLVFETPANAKVKAGEYREGFAEFRRRIAERPEDPIPHLQFAHALRGVGFGMMARDEARRGVELAPDWAAAWYILGETLEVDDLGRYLQDGMDWQGAYAAFRKAYSLDPGHEQTLFHLALLLENSPQGQRYATDVNPYESVLMFQRLHARLPFRQPYRLHYMQALLDSNRFPELAREAAKAPHTRDAQAFTIAVAAMEKGAPVAREQMAALPLSEQDRRYVQNTAGDYAFRTRHYDTAVQLWTSQGMNPKEMAAFRQKLSNALRLKRYEGVLLPSSDPAHVVQRLNIALFRAGREMDEMRELYWDPPPQGELLKEIGDAWHGFADQLRVLSKAFHTSAHNADLLATLSFESEGDDEIGYRIRCKQEGGPTRSWFVVKREGQYKIWRVGKTFAELGDSAFRAVEDGKLERAQQYLRWAYDELRKDVAVFDPLSGSPAARLWAMSEMQESADLKLVAAALMATAFQHIGILSLEFHVDKLSRPLL